MEDRKVTHLESKIKLLKAEKEAQEEYAGELEKLLQEKDKEIERLKEK